MAQERTEIILQNDHGLHARPAALFVQKAAGYRSTIRLRNLSKDGSKAVNAKSIMEVLTAGVDQGTRIELIAEGEDALQALQGLRALIEDFAH